MLIMVLSFLHLLQMSLDTWLTKKKVKEEPAHQCRYCHKPFGNAGALKSHMLCKHTLELHQHTLKGQSFLTTTTPADDQQYPLLLLGKRPFVDTIASRSPTSASPTSSSSPSFSSTSSSSVTSSTSSSSSPQPTKRRKRYSVEFKLKTLRDFADYQISEQHSEESSQNEFAASVGIDTSLVFTPACTHLTSCSHADTSASAHTVEATTREAPILYHCQLRQKTHKAPHFYFCSKMASSRRTAG